MGKKAYLFIVLMLLALSMANVIHAQSIPKPSVPEFTFMGGVSTSGYTSPTVFINGMRINITNQPYAFSVNGTTYVLCYDYRYKALSAQNWEESAYSQNNSYPLQSNSNTTILTIPEISLPQTSGAVQIDFQVQAIVEHYYQTESGTFIFPDETSGWSPTITINFPRPTQHTESPPPSPTDQSTTEHTPTSAPTTTEKGEHELSDFQLLLIIGSLSTAIIVGAGVALNIRYKKNNPRKQRYTFAVSCLFNPFTLPM
ncbi:MAG: hypothetical protein NWF00_01970 [Candidatus Bathyarchaeota archaeon]|nr:hypothetical protein [Candidatus Bathyarchaeota archaeon]